MQANEMINATSEYVPSVEKKVEKNYITFTEEELSEFMKTPGIETVTFTPNEWLYFVEELQSNTPFMAFRRAKYLVKTVEPPRKFETPKYPYVPYGDKNPGIDTVDLTPEEWNIFVEEVQSKSPFTAFNNAKYVVMLEQADADEEVTLSKQELERLING